MQAARTFNIHHAADLQGPLQSPSRPVLYTHTLCPYAQRVFLTLLYKAVPFELVQVDLSDKPAWYRAVNPRGLVPAVVHQGEACAESLDLCRWIDGAFNTDAPLTPAAPAARKQMDTLLSSTSCIVSAGLDIVAGSTAYQWGIGRQPSTAQVQRFEQQCSQLRSALQQHGGPYLCGAQPTLADVALLPFFERFRLALQLFQDYDLAGVQGGAVTQWMDHLHKQPWCQTAVPDEEKLAEAFRQHKSLDFFDYVTYDAFKVHPHLLGDVSS
ncbi:hypothetical protein OEZ85_008154 [Tetradesmus obliquus]|uniref:GST N-terminal domain-containing protein n=1 Tax=Tetradesmus obliquus TaxID=3088 RepID=A0ABY8TIB4_TETOB|nr:hypothetical protein OEZ85_008154 [Tetradesmus obliquus]